MKLYRFLASRQAGKPGDPNPGKAWRPTSEAEPPGLGCPSAWRPEAEKETCYVRAMTQGRLTNRSKHFIPFFERICRGTLDAAEERRDAPL